MITPVSMTNFAYDKALLYVEVYSPEGTHDAPGTPYGVSLEVPPLLLLHGNGGSIEEFKDQIAYFSKTRSVIAMDSRGQGKSTGASLQLTYELMADDVIEILNRLGVPEVHLVGFSDGAIISFILAKQNPLRVKTLTAIGGNIDPSGLTPEALEEIKRELAIARRRQEEPEFDHESETGLLELMIDEPHIKPASLKKVECPVILITGEHDMIDPKHTELICSRIPQCESHVIAGADHFVLDTHDTEVNALIEGLITAHEKRLVPIEPKIVDTLEIRKIAPEEEPLVHELYEDLLDSLETMPNYAGWKRGVHPRIETALSALESGELYGAFAKDSGLLVGSMILRFDYEDFFNACGWEILEPHQVLALRTVIARPQYRGGGVARSMVAFAQKFAEDHPDCIAIRFNTSGQNVPANYVYTRMGFMRYYSILMPYRGLDISDWTNVYEKRL